MNKNRELHELLGHCWHEDGADESIVHKCRSCGFATQYSQIFRNHCRTCNPDYAADPRLVLREMDRVEKLDEFILQLFDLSTESYIKTIQSISRLIALDTTGKLRDMAIEWLKGEGR